MWKISFFKEKKLLSYQRRGSVLALMSIVKCSGENILQVVPSMWENMVSALSREYSVCDTDPGK